jgi:hypothetical protein
MAAVGELRRPAVAPSTGRLQAWLDEVHSAWMLEVLTVIDAARGNGNGVWVRWGSVRYVDGPFAERLRESRAALHRLRPYYHDDTASRLWAMGELLDQLRIQLDRVVALNQSGDEFSAHAIKLLRALGCWCREVEQALGGLEWQALPPAARSAVLRLSAQGDPNGS